MRTGILSDATQKLVPSQLRWEEEEEEIRCMQAWEWACVTVARHCQPGGATGKPPSSPHPINTHLLKSRCMSPSQAPVPSSQHGDTGQAVVQGDLEPFAVAL